MKITESLLHKIYPTGGKWLKPCIPYFASAMVNITDDVDQCIFFTQVEHECDRFNTLREYADGSGYEGRTDLGNVEPGDGRRFPGRGGIQVTGRGAARAAGKALGVDFENHPEMMETPQWAIHVSAWFWTDYKPFLQPASKLGWLKETTLLVNGGLNGWSDRLESFNGNADVYGLPHWNQADETASIVQFQINHGLVGDGQVGRKTLDALMRTR